MTDSARARENAKSVVGVDTPVRAIALSISSLPVTRAGADLPSPPPRDDGGSSRARDNAQSVVGVVQGRVFWIPAINKGAPACLAAEAQGYGIVV